MIRPSRAVQDASPFLLRVTQGKCEVSSARRPELLRLPDFVWVACAPDSRSVYPVKALRASSAALRPAVTGQSQRLEVVHAESGAFGQCWPQEFIVGLR